MSAPGESSRGRVLAGRLAALLFVVFLQFAAQLRSLERVRNRYFRFWEAADGLALAADVLIVALALWALALAIERFAGSLLRRVTGHLFLLALASGAVSNALASRPEFATRHPVLVACLWMAIAGALGYSLGRPDMRLVSRGTGIALLFSPLLLIVAVPALTWERWGSPREPLAPLRGEVPSASPVFLFVFDEWSYARSTSGGELRPELPNLRRLAEHSIAFRNARSPAGDTYRSLPMIIYQTALYRELPRVFIARDGEERVTAAVPGPSRPESLFGLARDHGYNTALVGFYLPYRKMLGADLDRCRAYPFYPQGRSFPERMLLAGLENLRFWVDPVSPVAFRLLYARVFVRHWLSVRDRMQEDVRELIERFPDNTLALVHWLLPHAPYVFGEDGSFRGPLRVDFRKARNDDDDRMLGSAEDYLRNLRYMDAFVGDVVARLRAAGRYDDALLVLTSDHGWRYETEAAYLAGPDPVRHVPLLVKMPRQRTARVVDAEFPATRLRPLVEMVIEGRTGDEAALRALGVGAR